MKKGAFIYKSRAIIKNIKGIYAEFGRLKY